MINPNTAQKIAKTTTKICGYCISIIDSSGLIIGSGDEYRVNTIHGGVESVFKNKEVVEHDEEEVKSITGAYAGMLCPIIFNQNVIGAIGIRGNPDEVRKYASLVRNQVEMMYQQDMYFQISKLKTEAFDVFLQELLSDINVQDINHLKSLGQFNGYNLEIPRYAIMIEIDTLDIMITESNGLVNEDLYLNKMKQLLILINNFLDDRQNISSKIGSKHFLIFKTLSTNEIDRKNLYQVEELHQYLLEKQGVHSIIGVGNYYKNITHFKKSYHEAEQAVSVAKKMGYNNGVFHIEDLYVGRILNEVSDSVRSIMLDRCIVTKLLDQDDCILLETFYSLCKNNLNLSKAARELNIHRNTLLYRLNRIQTLTGLDPTNFHNAVHLFLLLKLKEFGN